ncbi:hypothetical protein A2715_05450 [Candidatus Woesebacteria bacterium RIFCSPHIGHO2_01_FULL_39_32]|uniref:Restriction endonuclease n=1 Tax=Candidatus Woesebacteria bacterium RIFCSPLOWO2_01_FULL_39_25 TaxID=1802521 RepID=A0A1F8BLQ5_9BACT|nr:MAG: hypothetical protein A2124_03895 [Candidatus Woesebacteria bacterium GWB1_37_5]OGM25465.1 MAG: hypothetical protein A2715_05450 [Candidatus Woesebacteria bacterium RIFCSPHIGHO2_01_FULL_39_32]OGM38568.1 MAG: hypothetical protein A3F01_04405 [Candidatus Woesebacteria bacterium RIFCSPHIGHO2_12_FULL_38_11]OGM64996.1 MAG: hypothetical protein A2893_05060 [Candidatus Woesebacteria bacterium RIFCSPLOWO2_01_FULL_39_25]
MDSEKHIEEIEFKYLTQLHSYIKNNLREFEENLAKSLNYLPSITLPIIMASIEGKSYNPFAEIIERHISYTVIKELLKQGFKFIPLGYSADLCFENDEIVLNIDIKTANAENKSDYNNLVTSGLNQTSFKGLLPIGVKGKTDYHSGGIKEIKVTPVLPTKYHSKLTVTCELQFIYEDYKDVIDSIREEYSAVRKIFASYLPQILAESFETKEDLNYFLNYKTKKSDSDRKKYLTDNLIRNYYIQGEREIKYNKKDLETINNFANLIIKTGELLQNKEIKPIAIIITCLPNGLLENKYSEMFVSGKSYGSSIRYHYADGKFKTLPGNPPRSFFVMKNKLYEKKINKILESI